MRLPFLHPGPPSGDDHDGLSGGPCASTRLLVGGILWFCLCLGLSLWLASREGGAVLVAEDGQPVLATGDWLRHRDRLDDLMRQTLSRVMPGCRLLTMPGFSEQEARHYRVEGDGAPLRLALALQERLCQEALRTGPDGEKTPQSRGGKGLKNYNITPKTGNVAGCRVVSDTDDVMLIENSGVIIRIPASSINVYKRDVQGVIVMRIEEGNQVVSLERVEGEPEEAIQEEPQA